MWHLPVPKELDYIWKGGTERNGIRIVGKCLIRHDRKELCHRRRNIRTGNALSLISRRGKQVSGNKLLTVARRLPIHLETLETNIEFKQSNRSAEFIRGEEETEDKYIRQGQLLHNLFSVIRTTDDVPPAIELLRFEGIIESAQQEEQIRKLTEWALKHPLVKEWYSGRWELYNECAIIYREKECCKPAVRTA